VAYLHLPEHERERVLRRASAAVAPNGTLLVVGHDATNLTEGYGGPQDPLVLATPEAVAAAIVGLEIEHAHTVEREVETDDGERIAIDHVIRSRRPG
jgi:outer membrane lipoprotein SlyB